MEKMGQIVRTSALGLFSLIAVGSANVCLTNIAKAEESPWTYWIGAGETFLEADAENQPGVLYEGRIGYKLDPSWEIEYGLGGTTFMEGNDFAAPSKREREFDGKNSPGETWMIKNNISALYHFNDAVMDGTTDKTWDPYVSANAGVSYFQKWNSDHRWSPFGGPGFGVSYWFDRDFALRADYNVVVATDDRRQAEINHNVLLMAYYNFGGDSSTQGRSNAASGEKGNNGLGDKSSVGLNTVYFDFDKSEIKNDSRQKLDSNYQWIKKNPGKKVSLEGHTDERGTNEYNLALGQRRAKAAFDYMRALGASPETLSITSYGEETPADPGHNEMAWAKNRRVESIAK